MQRNQHLIILAGLKTVLLFFCLISGSHAGAQQPKLILPTGHQGEMEILFSPDGSRILTNGEEGTAKLWDARSGRMLADLVGHKGKIEEVLFTSDGKKIITNAADNTVKIWNTLSGDMLFTLDANKGKISSVSLMNRGDRAIIEYDSATIFRISTIWDLASGKLLHTIPFSKYRTDNGEIIAVPPQTAFSPDGNFVARTDAFNYSQDSLVVLLTELTGKQRPRQLEGYFTGLGYLQYSPDGKTIRAACFKKYTGSPDTAQKTNDPSGYLEIMLWNAASGKLISKWTAGPWKNYNGRGNMVKQFDGRNVILISKEQQQDQTKAAVQVGDLVTRKLKFTIDLPPNEWKSYFFPDNQTFFLRTNKDSLMIWDLGSGRLLASPGKLTGGEKAYQFGEGNKILAFIQNNTVKIWDRASARLLFSLQHSTGIDSMRLGPLNKTLLTFTKDNTIHLWDLLTGRLLRSIPNGDNELLSAKQSGDGKYLAVITTVYEEEEEKEEEEEEQEMKTVDLWDLAAGKKLWSFSTQEEDLNYNFSPDSRSIILYKQERSYYRDTEKQGKENIELRDIQTGRLISGFTGNASAIQSAIISPGGDRIAITTEDSTVKLWDIPSGKFLPVWKGHTDRVNSVQYSADGKYVLSASADSTVKLWEAVSGKLLYTFPAAEEPVNTAQFSPDGKYIITATDYDAMIWDAATRQWIRTLEGGGAKDARFSPDGKYIITDGTLWNAATGEEIFYLDWHNGEIISNRFSPDSKYIVTASADETAKVWSTEFGELVFSLDDHADEVVYAAYSEDGRYIITSSLDNTIRTWDAPTGRLLQTRYLGPNTVMKDFSVKTNRMVYAEAGTELKIADGLTGEMLYSFYAVGSEDYLVVDKYRRYDGTENARKLLYFTCNDEIIELAQLKDKLWTPNLARRLMNGDSIFAPRLSELNICGLTPQVADKSDGKTGYRFVIKPRRGGLGETVLLVNGIEFRRYKPADLLKKEGAYELLIKQQELKNYFTPGEENKVTVKAYTADNAVSSRGIELTATDTTVSRGVPPDMYIVMIGVSDYKGTRLDLRYAGKDAADMLKTVTAAAGKLLNTDGKEHVFSYKLVADTTASLSAGNYRFPEKKAIQQTLEEIGNKATAKDILLIFFAGHGMMKSDAEKKQFYFLTASASDMGTDDLKEVGISTAELSEWIRPQQLKAQKRILIFDACASGQALNDIAGGALAVRSDDKSQQLKDIDRLNEKSGLFILSASASDQVAYELGRYNQGLLTYCLLKTIKESPEILDKGRLLNVAGWFNKAKDEVENQVSKINGRQQPQMISNTNFPVGRVDSSVLAGIRLAEEKPLFARSNFRNQATRTDNLRLRILVEEELEDIDTRGEELSVAFAPGYEGDDAYRLDGEYTLTGEEVAVNVVLIKGEAVIADFIQKGNKNDTAAIAAAIAQKAATLATANKSATPVNH